MYRYGNAQMRPEHVPQVGLIYNSVQDYNFKPEQAAIFKNRENCEIGTKYVYIPKERITTTIQSNIVVLV